MGSAVNTIRLTKIFDNENSLLVKWSDELKSGKTLIGFSDVNVAPLSSETAAKAIIKLIYIDNLSERVIHISPQDQTNYYEIAQRMKELYGGETKSQVKNQATDCEKKILYKPKVAVLKCTNKIGVVVNLQEEIDKILKYYIDVSE